MSKRIIMMDSTSSSIDLNNLEERKYYKFLTSDGTKLRGFITKKDKDFSLTTTTGSVYSLNNEGSFLHPFDTTLGWIRYVKKLKSEWYSW